MLSVETRLLRSAYAAPIRSAGHEAQIATVTLIVAVRDSRRPGIVGWGEGVPDANAGEPPEAAAKAVPRLVDAVGVYEMSPAGLRDAAYRVERIAGAGAASRCAIDTALHDLVAKVHGVPVHDLLGLPADCGPTNMTLGIDELGATLDKAREFAHFPALKVKVGTPEDLRIVQDVRRMYAGRLRVDANTAWTLEAATALLPALERLGVELIEQPLTRDDHDGLRTLRSRTTIPLVADESAVSTHDLDALVGVVDGINVKLAKCGGIGPAHRMLLRARELGFRTLLGSTGETSLGIAASASVAALADWIDLDASLLLAADPFRGLELSNDCRWVFSGGPGLGVTPEDGADIAADISR